MSSLEKGYEDDVGYDVILDKVVLFPPQQTTVVDLNLYLDVPEGFQAYLCSRTSAAKNGLITINCPIDPNYTDSVSAIVANVSGNVICYKAGEAFCQLIVTKVHKIANVQARKNGKRSNGRMGSTGAYHN